MLAQLLVLVLLLLLLLEGGMGMCVVVHGRGVVVLLLVLLVLLVLHDCGVVLIVAWVLGVVRLTVILLRSQGRRHRRQVLLLLLRWLSVCVGGGCRCRSELVGFDAVYACSVSCDFMGPCPVSRG